MSQEKRAAYMLLIAVVAIAMPAIDMSTFMYVVIGTPASLLVLFSQ